jgi:2-polyprenyl-3-methyl-5-hydroxy-6-metoxy-1,4-benzoquinol methylase
VSENHSASADAGRLEREAKFHDDYAAELDASEIDVDEMFTVATAIENKYILAKFGDLRGKRMLDYGCGSGEAAVHFAKQGAAVVGIDVSKGMLRTAESLAKLNGVAVDWRLVSGDAIPAEAGEFDFVYGSGVLHHVDLSVARRELPRVMRPNAIGCFIEPLGYNPVIDVYRVLANSVRTADEVPLTFEDVERFSESFGSVTHKEFWLAALAVFAKFFLVDRVSPKKERYWRKVYTDASRIEWFFEPLRKLDERVLSLVPALGRFCWTTVITLQHPRSPET